MAKSLQTLIPLLSSTFLLVAVAALALETTIFYYDYLGEEEPTLTYQGDAHVVSGKPYLTLTATDYSGRPLFDSVGRILHTAPATFSSLFNFHSIFKFSIAPYNGLPGDGLAFFIAPVGSQIPSGSFGGYLGVYEPSGANSTVFAVEFDTVTNDWDPDYPHVGINIGSTTSSNVTRVDPLVGTVTATVDYYAPTRRLAVTVEAGGVSYDVSYVYDLAAFLPGTVQVGISGATGNSIASLNVYSWFFRSAAIDGDDDGGAIREVV